MFRLLKALVTTETCIVVKLMESTPIASTGFTNPCVSGLRILALVICRLPLPARRLLDRQLPIAQPQRAEAQALRERHVLSETLSAGACRVTIIPTASSGLITRVRGMRTLGVIVSIPCHPQQLHQPPLLESLQRVRLELPRHNTVPTVMHSVGMP